MATANLLSGFKQIQTLSHGKAVVTSRWQHETSAQTIVVKSADAQAAPAVHSRLAYEYSVLQGLAERTDKLLKAVGLVQSSGGATTLVLEDIGGLDLHAWSAQAALPLAEVVGIGRDVARALVLVHQARVIHKDVTPQNIVLNRKTSVVQLVDFGISARLLREWQHGESLRDLEGTLPYLSPEQTGRVNRAIDYRTDFYSLGATLYGLLSGKPLFGDAHDLLEQVHAVISRHPPALHTVDSRIPAVLSDIVHKLMAKSPEDRYQSAHGIAEDLDRVAQALRHSPTVATFALGNADRCERFEPPQKLYGRDEQREVLLRTFSEAAVGQRRLVLISGSSGVGKSSLVHELQPSIVAHRGLFLRGKFDQMRRHLPLDALTEAVDQFVKEVLSEGGTTESHWKATLHQHLGPMGQCVVDAVPALGNLLGPQPHLPAMPPREAANRQLTAWRRLLTALCSSQPLVLFLDDLQWADSMTFALLTALLEETNACAGLLVIGAHRVQEEGDPESDSAFLEPLQQMGERFAGITMPLLPLSQNDVRALVADTLHTAAAEALADAVFGRTGGNAFFVGEFLKLLWNQEIISFDVRQGRWQWDLAAVNTLQATDNIADFMARQLRGTERSTQTTLSIAACVGDTFDLETLARLTEHDAATLSQALWPVVQVGLLLPLDIGHRYADASARFKFAHDRVRQAAYALLPANEAAQHHHAIAEDLLHKHGDALGGEPLFTVLHHYGRSLQYIQAEACAQVAQLHLTGAREAKRAAAYSTAGTLLDTAQTLLARVDRTDLHRSLEQELADVEYLTGMHTQALARLDALIDSAADSLEKARHESRRAVVLNSANKFDEAIAATLQVLSRLGLRLPARPTALQLVPPLLGVWLRLRRLPNVDVIATLPEVTDAHAMVLTEVLGSLAYACQLQGRHELGALTSWHLMRLSLQYGRSYATPFACALSALTMMAALGDVTLVKNLSRVATEMMSGGSSTWIASTRMALMTAFRHLTATVQEIADDDVETCQLGIAGGDMAGVVVSSMVAASYNMWLSLSRFDEFAQTRKPLLHDASEALMCFDVVQQTVRNLRGETEGPTSLTGGGLREEDMIPHLGSLSGSSFYALKLQCALIHRDFPAALDLIAHIRKSANVAEYQYTSAGPIHSIVFGVTLTQHARLHKQKRVAMPGVLRWCLSRLRWFVQHGGRAYSGLALWLNAEVAALHGNLGAALQGYEQALPRLVNFGMRWYVALAYECVGRLCLDHNMPAAGQSYMEQAQRAYETWGATAKVTALTRDFVFLAAPSHGPGHGTWTRKATHPTQTRTRTRTRTQGDQVDDSALLRAAQAISSEVHLDKVVQRLLDVLLSSAGADWGVLFLRENNRLVLQASRGANATHPGDAVAAMRLVNFVERTGKLCILTEGDSNPLWSDPYLRQARPKSVFGAPIHHKSALRGVLYLENHDLSHAFTPEHIGVVNLVAGQAAISLDNASLYAELERRVEARTVELRQAQEKLVRLEKDSTEMQMAGGFAHEMRNALFAATAALGDVADPALQTDDSPYVAMAEAVRYATDLAKAILSPQDRADLLSRLSVISQAQKNLCEAMDAALQSTQRAMRITTQILDYAELGRAMQRNVASNPAQVIEQTLQKLNAGLQQANITVECHVDGSHNVFLPEHHLQTIITHLVANARDAVSGREAPKIDIGVRHADSTLHIDIADNGPGIAAEVRDRLFQPFVSTKGVAGTGLGLAITRKLVELYGGTVAAQAGPAAGTRFTVSVPADLGPRRQTPQA